ncbi:WD40-like Beta Propeller [Macleaya cordata]|uniref:WD40-like Beta Propeller n=1 Tax=Macleaya cordata TaxID=56857 RepID=A0A200Q5D2_MACCD|nr:WD40-like Beta Propeller [Macleaya cordata]
MDPTGIIVFTTVGRSHYGFDVFSVKLPSNLNQTITEDWTNHQLTDGVSINFNGQFVDEDETLVYISERTGSARIYLNRAGISKSEQLPSVSESLFLWSAVYSTNLDDGKSKTVRLTPYGAVDYSPAVSQSGKFIAVASYEFRPWKGEFQELETDIVVFRDSDPTRRTVVCKNGGWPTWSGDSTIFFHRKADDGWWSIFRVDIPENFEISGESEVCRRITPPGVHAFTPAASHDGKRIAVATRRRGINFRHVEIFDLESESFYKVTECLNPNFHHYNPFFSPESGFLGYHRFRGESAQGELTIPNIDPVISPVKELRMFRLNGNFPSVSADGNLIAFNPDFHLGLGVKIVRSDGSKSWTVMKDRMAFGVSWSPTENNVIYSSVGPIFQSAKTAVQIARISFDPKHLDDDDREEIPAEVKILTREDSGNNAFPSCSPDGKHLVFRSGRSGHKNLYIVDAVNGEFNGEIRQLTEGPSIDTMPTWSPDGKLIAFSSNRHNPDDVAIFSIYVISPDGTNLRRVHLAGPEGSEQVDKERINHVCFSPDSKWLLFTANLGGVSAEPVSIPNQFQPYGDLYIARVDGSELKRLTWNGYENGTPAWHSAGDLDMGCLSLKTNNVGQKLRGQFEEPLWITCDL